MVKKDEIPDRSLADKAIHVKGNKYVEVFHRVKFFIENYPTGVINTEIINCNNESVTVKASIYPDAINCQIPFTGHASERIGDGPVNKNYALENCETGAVGRAFAFMDIGVIDSIGRPGDQSVPTKSEKSTNPPKIEIRNHDKAKTSDDLNLAIGLANEIKSKDNPENEQIENWKERYDTLHDKLPIDWQDRFAEIFATKGIL